MMQSFFDGTPYVFNLLAVQTLIVAMAIVVLGVYGLIREQGSQVSVVFFVLTLSIGTWLFAFSWMYCAVDASLAMWWAKAAYVGIGCIPAAAYHFCALILQDYERVRKRVLIVWLVSVIFVALILTTDIQLASLYKYPWGFYPKSTPITSLPFLLYFFTVMLMTLYSFLAGYRSIPGGSAKLTRLRTFLFAFGAGYLAAVDFIASFGVAWRPFGYISIAVFVAVSGRAIYRYRFMGITPAFAARRIIDTMNDALIVLDPDGVVRLVNQATCDLFGYQAEELVGSLLTTGMSRHLAFANQLEPLIRNSSVDKRELECGTQDGQRRTIRLSSSRMRNPAGEDLAVVCVLIDITERKVAEEERERLIAQLQKSNERLQAIDKIKSDFVSVVSHELRSPLTTIKSFTELILMKPFMPEQKKNQFMNAINVETDRLSRLITDLLDLARIESGTMRWRQDELSMETVIQDAVTSMRPLFENKQLRLTTDYCGRPSLVTGDRDRIVQVVINILSNAVKFTASGGAITITTRQESDSQPPQVVVEISDTGTGIPAAELEMIFEKFHRVGDQLTRKSEGTGLGLAISRQIIEHHGGRIWAVSEPGKGSTFAFTLPLCETLQLSSVASSS